MSGYSAGGSGDIVMSTPPAGDNGGTTGTISIKTGVLDVLNVQNNFSLIHLLYIPMHTRFDGWCHS